MRKMKLAALAVIASGLTIGGLTIGTAANADTVAANMGGCAQIASSVSNAMAAKVETIERYLGS